MASKRILVTLPESLVDEMDAIVASSDKYKRSLMAREGIELWLRLHEMNLGTNQSELVLTQLLVNLEKENK